MKICTECKTRKRITEFSRNIRTRDGYSFSCKACAGERLAVWRALNPQHKRPKAKKWPVRYKPTRRQQTAYAQLSRAVRLKQVRRVPCIICGNPKTLLHHPDYKRPLFVVSLCQLHHCRLHAGRFSLLPKELNT